MVIVGIDEVGRGCWAGPLVVCAVILKKPITGLKDSKLLSPSQREQLTAKIYEFGEVGVGWVEAHTIDRFGLTKATTLAMEEALKKLSTTWTSIIIDGSFNFLKANSNVQVVPKADVNIPCVSAASIVAKVTRDAYMSEAALKFPGYGFEKHVGYGTLYHRQQLTRLGPCDLHRLSYKPVKAFVR